jgi:hypothetical protein
MKVIWIAYGVALVALVAIKPQGQQTAPPGNQEEELTYVYHSHTKVIGQKDFDISAKVRVVCGQQKGSLKLCRLDVVSVQLTSKDTSQPPILYPGGPMSQSLDFSGRFYYQQSVSGEVLNVYHDGHEKQDVAAMKRAFVVLITGHIKDTEKSYEVEETDNQGKHVATYTVEPVGHQMKIYSKSKHPRPEDSYMISHKKVMHVNDRKQVHMAVQNETVQLKNRGDVTMHQIPDHIKKYVKPLPTGTESGNIDIIDAASNSSISLVSVKTVTFDANPRVLAGLKKMTIVTQMEREFLPPENFEETIEQSVDCMTEKKTPESPEFRQCYGSLVDTLRQLPDENLNDIAAHYLAPVLLTENSLDSRAILDGLEALAMNRQLAQKLLVRYIFRGHTASKELVVRAIHVCYTVQEPCQDLISAIRNLAFNQSSLPESLRESDVKERAILAYGALARSLSKVDPNAAEAIVQEIESAANEVPSVIERTTRSVHSSLTEHHWHELHYTKMMLLHSLGNAANERSKSLLVSHLHDDSIPSIWKRAAATALGQYSCEESANGLLKSLSQEEEESVWDEALAAYQRHPLSNNNSLADCLQERLKANRIFKRRSASDFLKKLNFKLELPGIDWGTRVGSKKLGASFGIRMKNKMELKTEQLATHFEVIVRDEGWVTTHLGILNLNVDILRAEACYHGYVSYDLDILKDFDISFAQGLANTFENIKDSVVGSIQRAIDAFQKILCKGCLKEIFNNFVNSVVDLPRFAVNLKQVIDEAVLAAEEFIAVPWVKPIAGVVRRVKGMAATIQSDIIDTVKVCLMYYLKYTCVLGLSPVAYILYNGKEAVRGSLSHTY